MCESKEKIIGFDDIGAYHESINNKHKMLVKLRRDAVVRQIERKINEELRDEGRRSELL